jgi:hypothetical protein
MARRRPPGQPPVGKGGKTAGGRPMAGPLDTAAQLLRTARSGMLRADLTEMR